MRKLKDGTVQYKKSAIERANSFNRPSFPLTIYRTGQKIQVFMGCGYSTAFVVESHQDRCIVRLARTGRVVSVYDQRSIKEVKQEYEADE